jgi:hypothetical protein
VALGILISATAKDMLNAPDIIGGDVNPQESFSFDAYRDAYTLHSDLKKLFPLGTEKSYVDNVLVVSGGAETRPSVDGDFVIYAHDASPSFWFYLYLCPYEYKWQVRIYYDDNERVRDIKLRGPC